MPYNSHKDWVPDRDGDLVVLVEKWDAILKSGTSVAQFKWDEDEVVLALTAIRAFLTTYAEYMADNSSANRVAKDETKKAVKKAMREFANTSIRYNRNMRKQDKELMGVPVRDEVNTPVTTPDTGAVIGDLVALRGHRVRVGFHDEATPFRRAIPYGCNGCLLLYTVSDTPITDEAALTNSKLMTRNPFTLTLDQSAERKYFSAAVRWQTTRGDLGPISEIHSTLIT